MFLPIVWSANRKPMNVVEIRAESMEEIAENIMVNEILSYIEASRQFKGVPCQREQDSNSEFKVTVLCDLIFPNEQACKAFMMFLRDNLW